MKAVVIEENDKAPVLTVRDIAIPEPGAHDLLIEVKCVGVNFADLYRAKSHFGATLADNHAVAGLEMAGKVVGFGDAVTGYDVGDRIMGLTTGTYAQFCLLNHKLAIKLPTSMDWKSAAATAATYMTAHDALITNGELTTGETVFIQAASSGVGIAATQIAKHFGASLIIGTSGSPEKIAKLKHLGLDVGINTKREDFVGVVNNVTDGKGADVIIENIGGDTLARDIDCAAVKCRIINVGRLGKWVGEINLDEHSRRRVKLIGVTFRTRSIEEHGEVARRAAADLIPAFESGALKPIVDRVFPLEAASEAQDYMKSGKHFGKIILEVA